jgi:hypothetical protein
VPVSAASGRIVEIFLSEVALYSLQLLLDAAQDADGDSGQRYFAVERRWTGDPVLEVNLEQLIWAQFRPVTAQIEDLCLVCVFLDPLAYVLRVLCAQVIHNQ